MKAKSELQRAVDLQAKLLAGPSSIEKHILLLKLVNLKENSPDFSIQTPLGMGSNQRQWLAEAGALIGKVNSEKKTFYKTLMLVLHSNWEFAIQNIQGIVMDLVEELKLDLELSGEANIGTVYAEGEVYNFYADLKEIVNSAKSHILLVDPYFNGEAFDHYLSDVDKSVEIQIIADKFSTNVKTYVDRHRKQFRSTIELRSSQRIHDRILFVDSTDCWIMGASIKDGGKKVTYLIPTDPVLATKKFQIYDEIRLNSEVL